MFQDALTLLCKCSPSKKRKIAQVIYFIGAEYKRKGKYHSTEKCYEESLKITKLVWIDNIAAVTATVSARAVFFDFWGGLVAYLLGKDSIYGLNIRVHFCSHGSGD